MNVCYCELKAPAPVRLPHAANAGPSYMSIHVQPLALLHCIALGTIVFTAGTALVTDVAESA